MPRRRREEIQRLFTTLIAYPARDLAHRLSWTTWRRRHQAAPDEATTAARPPFSREDHDLWLEY